MKLLKSFAILVVLLSAVPSAHAEDAPAGVQEPSAPDRTAPAAKAASVDELLRLIEQGIVRDQKAQRQRIAEFERERDKQGERLEAARKELKALEARTAALEKRHLENDNRLAEEEVRMNERLGELRELFGVLQQTTGEFRSVVKTSPISSQVPGRGDFLVAMIKKAGSSTTFPTIREIQKLWYEMQREIAESGRAVHYRAAVVDADGNASEADITRIGTFNIVSDGRYFVVDAESGNVVELAEQPAGRYLDVAEDFEEADPGEVEAFWLDPSRGSILNVLIQSPGFGERIRQGGLVGYIIIALGLAGVLLSFERFYTLSRVEGRVQRQIESDQISTDNPLGRVMDTFRRYQRADRETLELKLTEAIAQETPVLQRYIPVLKVIFVVAPLLGLLGTVTGMIQTFQAITLFGTGDPKLMAGGISQALVTTVQGLCVAIPVVLLHTLASGRARRITQVIEERAVGLMAERAEIEQGHAFAS